VAAAVEQLAEAGLAGLTARSLAARAGTSPAALYELVGDRAALARALAGEGFRRLGEELGAVRESDDPVADVWAVLAAYRRFIRSNQALAEVMFWRPVPEFTPGPDDLAVAAPSRSAVSHRVRRCLEAGRLRGDEADVTDVLVALTQGMVFAEVAGRLGPSTEPVERRWRLALGTLLNGLAP
jgi:AcrR family transcriptional regulator